jgi:hypothetical protein
MHIAPLPEEFVGYGECLFSLSMLRSAFANTCFDQGPTVEPNGQNSNGTDFQPGGYMSLQSPSCLRRVGFVHLRLSQLACISIQRSYHCHRRQFL